MMKLDTTKIYMFNMLARHDPLFPLRGGEDAVDSVVHKPEHQLALDLIIEENKEVDDAIWAVTHSADYNLSGTDEDLFKEILDSIWVKLSYCMRRGWDVEEGFRRLGESNLSKFNVDKDGLLWAEYLPTGKVKKSANYKPVDLSDLIAEKAE